MFFPALAKLFRRRPPQATDLPGAGTIAAFDEPAGAVNFGRASGKSPGLFSGSAQQICGMPPVLLEQLGMSTSAWAFGGRPPAAPQPGPQGPERDTHPSVPLGWSQAHCGARALKGEPGPTKYQTLPVGLFSAYCERPSRKNNGISG